MQEKVLGFRKDGKWAVIVTSDVFQDVKIDNGKPTNVFERSSCPTCGHFISRSHDAEAWRKEKEASCN